MRDDKWTIEKYVFLGLIYFVALGLAFVLNGCKASYHLKKADKHAKKALIKGATIQKDTVHTHSSDTTVLIDTLDNYIYKTMIVKDTVYVTGDVQYIYKTRYEVRQDNKTERKKIKQDTKAAIKTNKHREKTNRKEMSRVRLWWIWLLLGIIIGVLGMRVKKKFLT